MCCSPDPGNGERSDWELLCCAPCAPGASCEAGADRHEGFMQVVRDLWGEAGLQHTEAQEEELFHSPSD